MSKILVTGSAGFIGFHLVKALIEKGENVVGIDNLNEYYDSSLKKSRLSALDKINDKGNYVFYKINLEDRVKLEELFDQNNFDVVVNLAAQAGVRYSLENPDAYIDSNIVGFANILEGCRKTCVSHLLFASSSSVYGMNTRQPFSVQDNVDFPVSLYAATKKSNELMAHAYSHLYNIAITGLRFFTVYGPFGRPDMAYYKFTKSIINGDSIDVYNNGEMERDFTYIDDVIHSLLRLMQKTPAPMKSELTRSSAPFKIYNIGNSSPVSLNRFISAIETACGIRAKKNLLPMQAGDVPSTYADVEDLEQEISFRPSITIENGIKEFVTWYQEYHSTP
jgi:UDP-glucuronate 4-epimerase